MRRTVVLIASVLVSALFLWLALRGVELEEVGNSIQQANFAWVALAFASMSLGMWTRGRRWYGLLDFKMPFMRTAHILNIGFFLNLLPLRIGEVARSLLATRNNVPLMTAATSVVVERMLDTLLVVIMLVVAITRLPDVPDAIATPTTLFGIAVVTAFIVLIFFARFPVIGHRFVAFFERLLPFLKRIGLGRLFDNMLDGLKPLTHLRSAIDAIIWTLISWSVSFFTLFCLVNALGVTDANGVVLTLGSHLLLTTLGLSLASFSIAIPITVAALGPFELAILAAGQAVGAPDAQSTSLGFLFHGVNIIGYATWGIVGLLALGVSLSEVMSQSDKKKVEVPEGA